MIDSRYNASLRTLFIDYLLLFHEMVQSCFQGLISTLIHTSSSTRLETFLAPRPFGVQSYDYL